MHPFEIMAEPVRRRIVEILASGEHSAGDIAEVVGREFGITGGSPVELVETHDVLPVALISTSSIGGVSPVELVETHDVLPVALISTGSISGVSPVELVETHDVTRPVGEGRARVLVTRAPAVAS